MPRTHLTAQPIPEGSCPLEYLLDRFEVAWQDGGRPALEDFLPPRFDPRQKRGNPAEVEILHELVKIDLEYRWRRPGPEGAPCLEDYVRRLPALGRLSRLPVELIGEEYRVRRRLGDRPDPQEYSRRFSRHGKALDQELARIDAELDAEQPTACLRGKRSWRVRETNERPPGRRVGRYELGEQLGAGGFGSVWRGWDTELAREVAVKVPRGGQFTTSAERERFLREARSAAQLHHPGIVAVHDVGADDETMYIVAELVPGVNLAERIRCARPGFTEAARLVAQVAEALHYAHGRGVIHRDLKPGNILLQEEGAVARETNPEEGKPGNDKACWREGQRTPLLPRITDFGLALRDSGEVTMTVDGQVLGTPAYMSPEQIQNPHAVDGRSDLYSLGVILYELLTGELPFRGSPRMLLHQVLTELPRPPRQLEDRIPRDLETICLKCLARDPERRYPTAAALAADLRRWLAGEPIHARPVGWLERLGLALRRNPSLLVCAALAAAALVAVLAAPAAMVLVAITAGALLLALQRTQAAADLQQAADDRARDHERTAAALQFALKNLALARQERERIAAAEARARRQARLGQELARAVILDLPGTTDQTPAFLVRTLLSYLEALAAEAGDDPVQRRELALGYAGIARMQADLDDAAAALASQRRSLKILTVLAETHPDNRQAQRDLAAARRQVREYERTLTGSRR